MGHALGFRGGHGPRSIFFLLFGAGSGQLMALYLLGVAGGGNFIPKNCSTECVQNG